MRLPFLLSVLLLFFHFSAAAQQRLDYIDFFGHTGVNTRAIREALPFREGDLFPTDSQGREKWKSLIKETARSVTGRDATDASMVCCTEASNWIIFIGVDNGSSSRVVYNAPPRGRVRLVWDLVKLDRELTEAWMAAVQKGSAREEHSTGYALSSDPDLRRRQMRLRSAALENEDLILRVLKEASDESQRAIAATALGYVRQSKRQVDGLVRAASDPNGTVRNNAVRALMVLLKSKPQLRERVPPRVFIDLVRSGIWTDRNKGSFVLLELAAGGDPLLLNELKETAVPALKEIASWQSRGHAEPARVLLERMGVR